MRISVPLSTVALICLSSFPAICSAQAPDITPLSKQVARLEETVARNAKNLQDWPNLARYRDANAAAAVPVAGESRVVFMGDSITDMWPEPRFGEFFPGKPYIGRGISGQTTPQMLIRFRPDVIALKPRVVVILAGTNDIAGNTGPMSLEEIEANYASMAELASAHHIRVIFSSVLPVHNYTPQSLNLYLQRSPKKILELNRWLREYCEA